MNSNASERDLTGFAHLLQHNPDTLTLPNYRSLIFYTVCFSPIAWFSPLLLSGAEIDFPVWPAVRGS